MKRSVVDGLLERIMCLWYKCGETIINPERVAREKVEMLWVMVNGVGGVKVGDILVMNGANMESIRAGIVYKGLVARLRLLISKREDV